MRHRPESIPAGARGFALAAALALAAPIWAPCPATAGVQVAVLPAVQNVTPGVEFEMTLGVTQAGSGFNAFNATVTYDTTALTFLPAVPISAQQGCLMTGACSAACGNTFHRFTASHDSLVVSNSLLCNQVSLTGPGTIYKLRFRAKNTPQETWIRIRAATFLDAGLFVTPVTTADAHVGIGVTLAVGDPPPPVAGLSVRAEPNPSRGRVAFAIESDRAGGRSVEVYDLAGRLVRRLEDPRSGAGPSRVPWDGNDLAGARVRPGIYLVTVRAADRVARSRFAVIE